VQTQLFRAIGKLRNVLKSLSEGNPKQPNENDKLLTIFILSTFLAKYFFRL
jgi:hypothetical protein